MRKVVAVLGLVLVVGLVPGSASSGERCMRRPESADVYEALFRYQFDWFESWSTDEPFVYYVGTCREGASPAFTRRFAGHTPPVRSGFWGDVGGEDYRNANSMFFHAERLRWSGRERVRLFGGHRGWGGWGMSRHRYVLERQGRTWVVVQDYLLPRSG